VGSYQKLIKPMMAPKVGATEARSERVITQRAGTRKRSLHGVNEHFELIHPHECKRNAASAASAIF